MHLKQIVADGLEDLEYPQSEEGMFARLELLKEKILAMPDAIKHEAEIGSALLDGLMDWAERNEKNLRHSERARPNE